MSLIEPAAPERIVPARGSQSFWSEERAERCKALWKEGHSATYIAIELGEGLTRNAIIGKIMRMGLRRGGEKRAPAIRPKRSVGEAMRVSAIERRKEIWGRGALATDLPADTGDNPMQLFDLEDCHCRWPVSGEGHLTLFCGGDAYRDLPYCVRHCRMAYVK